MLDERDRARRWELVLPHRDRLLRLARQLVRDPGDAEACVQEALARCVTFPALDESNVAGFLVTTTRRLCMDHHRGHARDGRVAARVGGAAVYEPGPDEVVCDRAEAAWVSARLADLPVRQRAVVLARAAGQTPQEIADRLAVSYKTVETLLYRVRTRARAELERAYAVVALQLARRPRADWSALGAASVAVVAGTSSLLAPPAPGTPAPDAPPVVVALATAGPAGDLRELPAPPAALAPAPAPRTSRPSRTPSPDPAGTPWTMPPCPAPPYWADPCVSDEPVGTPTGTPGLPTGFLDCVRYGIDTRSGFDCYDSPTPRPPGSRPSQGGDT